MTTDEHAVVYFDRFAAVVALHREGDIKMIGRQQHNERHAYHLTVPV
jgi:hypothetical protein